MRTKGDVATRVAEAFEAAADSPTCSMGNKALSRKRSKKVEGRLDTRLMNGLNRHLETRPLLETQLFPQQRNKTPTPWIRALYENQTVA